MVAQIRRAAIVEPTARDFQMRSSQGGGAI
jgi:hypothetical protein